MVQGQVVRGDLVVGLGGVAERAAIVLHAMDTALARSPTAYMARSRKAVASAS